MIRLKPELTQEIGEFVFSVIPPITLQIEFKD